MTVWFALAGTQSTFRSLNWQLFHAIKVDIQEFLTDKASSAEKWFYHFLEKSTILNDVIPREESAISWLAHQHWTKTYF